MAPTRRPPARPAAPAVKVVLFYDGQTLTWRRNGVERSFPASSGLLGNDDDGRTIRAFAARGRLWFIEEDYRLAAYQYVKDRGPTPAGQYTVLTAQRGPRAATPFAGFSADSCTLAIGSGVERIPRTPGYPTEPFDPPVGGMAYSCEAFWANWGDYRVRLEPRADTKTRGRGGFYLHDSSKGYTHGCIETGQALFTELLVPYEREQAGGPLVLQVTYTDDRRTYGGTSTVGGPSETEQAAGLKVLLEECGQAVAARSPQPAGGGLWPPPQWDLPGWKLGAGPVNAPGSLAADKVDKARPEFAPLLPLLAGPRAADFAANFRLPKVFR